MAHNILQRYIWVVDTIRRYGTITRTRLDELWQKAPLDTGGTPFSRRTFYNDRQGIAELFGITIDYNPATFEYSIAPGENPGEESVANWLLNSAAVSNTVSNARDVARNILVDDVPSARTHLAMTIRALQERHPIRFSYHPYTRPTPRADITVEPYFLKIFRQRWYVTGFNRHDRRIKTYALDRIVEMAIDSTDTFEPPAGFDARQYTSDSFGIIFDEGEPQEVMLRVDPHRAKYLRALPLHHSQRETLHDSYSVFSYRLKITHDLVQELLSLGASVTVLAPAQLRNLVAGELRNALAGYESGENANT